MSTRIKKPAKQKPDDNLKVGSIVHLRHGGRLMTVIDDITCGIDMIAVAFWVGEKLETMDLPRAALVPEQEIAF